MMDTGDFMALIHLAGFLTGVGLFALLSAMTWRAGTTRERHGPIGTLPLAAVSGLVWNAGALFVFGSRDFGVGHPSHWLTELWSLGFLLLTVVYGGILLRLAATARWRSGAQGAMTVLALGAFALSAYHLSHHTNTADSWWVELLGHHASLPLVLVILYQDYRFALADLFLKRALAILVLVAMVLGSFAAITRLGDSALFPSANERAVLVAAWIATALVYPTIRRAADHFVDRCVLRRVDYRQLRQEIASIVAAGEDAPGIMEPVCDRVRAALNARSVTWQVEERSEVLEPSPRADRDGAATVLVPTTDAPRFAMTVGLLAGGRRLLSDDAAFLDAVAALTARRLDELRVAQERVTRDTRESELRRLSVEAELRALRAQLNPHFLFNALTTIGYLIRHAPGRATAILYDLTALLRGVLRPESGDLVRLSDELQLVNAYLAIERARFEERLTVESDVPASLGDALIPSLVLQPLVENALKHGIGRRRRGGVVRIEAAATAGGVLRTDERLMVRVFDSGPGMGNHERRSGGGVGLSNVERRLQLYYGSRAGLRIDSAPERGTTVELFLPLSRADAAAAAGP